MSCFLKEMNFSRESFENLDAEGGATFYLAFVLCVVC